MTALPVFKGYTVDYRLGEFRKFTRSSVEYISFSSVRGRKLLQEMEKEQKKKREAGPSAEAS